MNIKIVLRVTITELQTGLLLLPKVNAAFHLSGVCKLSTGLLGWG